MLFLLAYLMFTILYFVYGHEYAYFVMNIFGKRSIMPRYCLGMLCVGTWYRPVVPNLAYARA